MKIPSSILNAVLIAGLAVVIAVPATAATRVGGGLHYLKTVGDMKDAPGFDDSALGFLASAASSGELLRLEGDVEFIPDYAGTDELMWEPQGYLLIGDFIYGGAGVGIGHLGSFGWQDPFYALRAGVDFAAGGVDLDVFTSYRFEKAKDLESLNRDSLNALTFGAIIRFGGD